VQVDLHADTQFHNKLAVLKKKFFAQNPALSSRAQAKDEGAANAVCTQDCGYHERLGQQLGR
jgi:hypothetical protein